LGFFHFSLQFQFTNCITTLYSCSNP